MNTIRPIISQIDHSDLSTTNITNLTNRKEETIMTSQTFQPTQDQMERIEQLRNTTIAGNSQSMPKTPEQMIHQIIEYGIRALEQQRKQYTRQREALRSYAKK